MNKSVLPTNLLRKLSSTRIVLATTLVAVVVALASGYMWWAYVRSTPERVFWAAVNNALSTSSVSRQIARDSDTQQPDQFTRIHTTPNAGAVGLNKYYQSGDQGEPTLVTETLGTTDADFIRILDLKSANPNEPTPDISSVRGVWANTTGESFGAPAGQLYNQFVLGIIPFGHLSGGDRKDLVKQMQDTGVYDIDFDAVGRNKDNGRPTYVYNVKVNTVKYLQSLKQFAKYIGSDQLEGVNPADYEGSRPLAFQITVDKWSRQIIITQQAGTPPTRYHSYGLAAPPVVAPKNAIPIQELQDKLQKLQ